MTTTIPTTSHLLKKLRSLMQVSSAGSVAAYIVPSGDAHQSEYIAKCDMRRQFISKFTGSAGTAVITLDKAALWTDGRYHLQASKELDPDSWILMKDGLPDTPTISEWLKTNLSEGNQVGVDPYLLSHDAWKRLSKELRSSSISLVGIKDNLIDLVWTDSSILSPNETPRPPAPKSKIFNLTKDIAGKEWTDKVIELRAEMTKKKTGAIILTALDDIAWLLNLRGSDIDYNPVFFSYCIVTKTRVILFIHDGKIDPQAEDSINAKHDEPEPSPDVLHVEIRPYDSVSTYIVDKVLPNEKELIWVSGSSSEALVSLVPKAKRFLASSPVTKQKRIKNEVEIKNMRDCHIRDAAALCEFLAWLDVTVEWNPKGHDQLWEIPAADYLEECRKAQDKFMGLSFPSISASGPNGAVIHYHPSESTKRPIGKDELYLIDSGAQYLDGTTDVTRTYHFGEPTQKQKECFTLVLKGHIQLALAVFPRLTKGVLLDSFARQHLWSRGLDYLHGTGHGVGMFLNVHEGPSSISPRGGPDDPGLEAGQILSNEPGYYEDGEFGIRIESLVVTHKTSHQNREFLCFETLTLVPIQLKMIIPGMMTRAEIQWLNMYHNKCKNVVGDYLRKKGKDDVIGWLERSTKPLSKGPSGKMSSWEC